MSASDNWEEMAAVRIKTRYYEVERVTEHATANFGQIGDCFAFALSGSDYPRHRSVIAQAVLALDEIEECEHCDNDPEPAKDAWRKLCHAASEYLEACSNISTCCQDGRGW